MIEETPWPPDYDSINREKINRVKYLYAHPEKWTVIYNSYRPIQGNVAATAERCILWIEHWVATYDPRRKNGKKIPFILFKRQKEFVHFIFNCIEDNESGLVEKSRDVGASWLCCAIACYLWIYIKGSSIGFGSLLVTKVDRIGDMDSLMEKIRFIIQCLPNVFTPIGYRPTIHATWMKIRNPENMSLIKGDGGRKIGRSGRSGLYFKDESAHYEHAEEIEAALGDNTDVQIDISSVHGSANVFYKRRMGGEVWFIDKKPTPGKTRVFIFDWREHPGKTQEWYDRRRQKALDDGLLHVFAQEVDRDYAGSIDRVIIPAEWARACIDAHIKLAHLGNWEEGDWCSAQDLADEGNDKNAQTIRKGFVLRYADHWGGDPGAAAEIAIPKCVEYGCYELFYDSIGVGAGFKVEVNTMKKHPSWPKKMKIHPWNAGNKGDALIEPDEHIIKGDKESPINRDFYANLKAQAWFRTRTRCYKTWQAITQGKVYPVSELISFDSKMPRVQQIVMELAQAVHAYSTEGKTLVDKKPDGAMSPNLADSVIMNYNPIRPAKGFFDVG